MCVVRFEVQGSWGNLRVLSFMLGFPQLSPGLAFPDTPSSHNPPCCTPLTFVWEMPGPLPGAPQTPSCPAQVFCALGCNYPSSNPISFRGFIVSSSPTHLYLGSSSIITCSHRFPVILRGLRWELKAGAYDQSTILIQS